MVPFLWSLSATFTSVPVQFLQVVIFERKNVDLNAGNWFKLTNIYQLGYPGQTSYKQFTQKTFWQKHLVCHLKQLDGMNRRQTTFINVGYIITLFYFNTIIVICKEIIRAENFPTERKNVKAGI